jgi:hypothetical protein
MKNSLFLLLLCLISGISAKSQTNLSLNLLPQPIADTVSTSTLVSMVADSNIVSFTIAAKSGETWVDVKSDGNKLSETSKQLIFLQKPGQKVFVEHLTAIVNGQEKKLPGTVYVIK